MLRPGGARVSRAVDHTIGARPERKPRRARPCRKSPPRSSSSILRGQDAWSHMPTHGVRRPFDGRRWERLWVDHGDVGSSRPRSEAQGAACRGYRRACGRGRAPDAMEPVGRAVAAAGDRAGNRLLRGAGDATRGGAGDGDAVSRVAERPAGQGLHRCGAAPARAATAAAAHSRRQPLFARPRMSRRARSPTWLRGCPARPAPVPLPSMPTSTRVRAVRERVTAPRAWRVCSRSLAPYGRAHGCAMTSSLSSATVRRRATWARPPSPGRAR
jgi:hypothetical protein